MGFLQNTLKGVALSRLQLNGCLRNARRPIGTNAAYEKDSAPHPWQLD